MGTSQRYLGIPNAVVLCIDRYTTVYQGRFYHHFSKDAVIFHNDSEMLLKIEKLYDDMNFPFRGNNERHFIERKQTPMKEELTRVMEDDEMLEMHGDLGTFIIRVQHRQNSSWQGRITWVEEDKTLYFRSVWEMMKLIEEAMSDKKDEIAEDQIPTWKE
ncbi:MAG: hypothetical protein IJI46_06230 [Erysipelotrichaceae bacterium]|nr:hypothetical protein [Erysipelotrichaceae bacterium]